jgi:acetylornithine deacetylase/succinyl-diaminopimelate desuccinylase-like protein
MQEVLAYIEQNKTGYVAQLAEVIGIPSISTDAARRNDMQRCAEWLAAHLRSIGMRRTQVTSTAGNPIVYSEWCGAKSAPTILLYAHYDVQPPDPLELWTSPPFQLTIRDGKLYARGSTDDKGQPFIHLKAIEAHLQTVGRLPVNMKIVVEGEEETGGQSLPTFLAGHKDLLKSDLAVISDTAFFANEVPSICCGLRGNVYFQLDLQGANRDLHSGLFGGSVHNPIQALSEIIAQLHDGNGRVTVRGFYDDVRPITREEREAFRRLPWADANYKRDLGVDELYGETGFSTLERLWARPTLDCCGIVGGYTGEGIKSVIPALASAKVSMRLVPDQSPAKIATLFNQHIRRIAPATVRLNLRCLAMAEPSIIPMDSPGMRAAVPLYEKALARTLCSNETVAPYPSSLR